MSPFPQRSTRMIEIEGLFIPNLFPVDPRPGARTFLGERSFDKNQSRVNLWIVRVQSIIMFLAPTLVLLILGLKGANNFTTVLMVIALVCSIIVYGGLSLFRRHLQGFIGPVFIEVHPEVASAVSARWGNSPVRLLVNTQHCNYFEEIVQGSPNPAYYHLLDARGRYLGPLKFWLEMQAVNVKKGKKGYTRFLDAVKKYCPENMNELPLIVSKLENLSTSQSNNPGKNLDTEIDEQENRLAEIFARVAQKAGLEIDDIPDKL